MSKRTAKIPWFASAQTSGSLLVIAAVGILIQIATGVDEYPLIPPGALILGGVGLILLFVPWRWTIVLGLLASAFIINGGLGEELFMQRLGTPGDFGPFLGSWVQTAGTLLACLVSIVGIVYAIITPKPAKASPA